jgi:hypothetical protein
MNSGLLGPVTGFRMSWAQIARIYLSLFINMPPAIDQKLPRAETSPNRVLKNDACANV